MTHFLFFTVKLHVTPLCLISKHVKNNSFSFIIKFVLKIVNELFFIFTVTPDVTPSCEVWDPADRRDEFVCCRFYRSPEYIVLVQVKFCFIFK